jgi:hypothetical protein
MPRDEATAGSPLLAGGGTVPLPRFFAVAQAPVPRSPKQ